MPFNLKGEVAVCSGGFEKENDSFRFCEVRRGVQVSCVTAADAVFFLPVLHCHLSVTPTRVPNLFFFHSAFFRFVKFVQNSFP